MRIFDRFHGLDPSIFSFFNNFEFFMIFSSFLIIFYIWFSFNFII